MFSPFKLHLSHILENDFFWEKSEAGVGRTQYKLLLICGLAFCSDAAKVGHDGPCLVGCGDGR